MERIHGCFLFCVTLGNSWGKRAAHNRAQITYYMAENLELRRNEFAQRISAMTGCDLSAGLREVDLSIERLYHWSAYADKFGGSVQVSLADMTCKHRHS